MCEAEPDECEGIPSLPNKARYDIQSATAIPQITAATLQVVKSQVADQDSDVPRATVEYKICFMEAGLKLVGYDVPDSGVILGTSKDAFMKMPAQPNNSATPTVDSIKCDAPKPEMYGIVHCQLKGNNVDRAMVMFRYVSGPGKPYTPTWSMTEPQPGGGPNGESPTASQAWTKNHWNIGEIGDVEAIVTDRSSKPLGPKTKFRIKPAGPATLQSVECAPPASYSDNPAAIVPTIDKGDPIECILKGLNLHNKVVANGFCEDSEDNIPAEVGNHRNKYVCSSSKVGPGGQINFTDLVDGASLAFKVPSRAQQLLEKRSSRYGQ